MTVSTRMRTATRATLLPSQVANLQMWFKADALALADTNPVQTWTDSSGGGLNATQATLGFRPLYRTGVLNGQPVVRFDGTDDFMVTSTTAFATSSVRTVIAVGKRNGAGGGVQRIWGLHHATVSVFDNSPTWAYYANQANGAVDLGGTIANASVLSVVWAGTSSATGYVNGAAGTSFDPNDQYASQRGICLGNSVAGAADYWNGDIAEVAIYDRALPAVELRAIERGLGVKYGIPVS